MDEFYEQHVKCGIFVDESHLRLSAIHWRSNSLTWNSQRDGTNVFLGPVSGMSDVLSIAQQHLPTFCSDELESFAEGRLGDSLQE